MTANLYILIDIGGTAIKYAISNSDGLLVTKDQIPTEAKTYGGSGIVNKVFNIIDNYIKTYDNIKGVAISTAGMVDKDSGVIIYALEDAIPNYTNTDFVSLIKHKYDLPCTVENDVNCAALGELWLGAAKGLSSIFCMTIGTSIGGAMIQNGHLVHGASNSAGEIAYMQVKNGMLHKLASTTALVTAYAKLINKDVSLVNGMILFDNAQQGQVEAIVCIDKFIDDLTDGITNVICCQNPQAIVLGGGIMARDEFLKPRILTSLKAKLRPIVFENTKLEFAKLLNDAGMLGALYNYKQKQNI